MGRGAPARVAARPAWAICAVAVTLAALSLVFGAWNYDSVATLLTGVGWNAVLGISFPVVGALIATHRPRKPMGWIFCAAGLSEGLVGFAWEYGVYGLLTALLGAVYAGVVLLPAQLFGGIGGEPGWVVAAADRRP
jgi:hypothetical protein